MILHSIAIFFYNACFFINNSSLNPYLFYKSKPVHK